MAGCVQNTIKLSLSVQREEKLQPVLSVFQMDLESSNLVE